MNDTEIAWTEKTWNPVTGCTKHSEGCRNCYAETMARRLKAMGAKARPMKEEWVLNIRRQCEEQGVPFFFKQWGTWGADGVRRDKKANGFLLQGKKIQQYPEVENGN